MKILLVDDSKSARYALRLELQRHGAEVTTADSAEAAFELLKGDLPDAVLMDHTMPGLNGFEALDLIRADPRTARLPVIICSSNEDPDFAAAAAARGAYGILPKSTATDTLPALLGRLRGTHSSTQASAQASAQAPAPTAAAPAPTVLGVTEAVPEPDLRRLIDQRVAALVEDRIEARLSGLLQPLLRDLELGLTERLTAVVRQRIESERTQALALVDQYVRELTARESAAAGRLETRLGELDGVIAAKAREIVRREVAESMEEAVQHTRRTGDDILRQMQSNRTMIHLSIFGAAAIGVLAAAAAYFLPHWG